MTATQFDLCGRLFVSASENFTGKAVVRRHGHSDGNLFSGCNRFHWESSFPLRHPVGGDTYPCSLFFWWFSQAVKSAQRSWLIQRQFLQAVGMPVIPNAGDESDQRDERNQSKDELVSCYSRVMIN